MAIEATSSASIDERANHEGPAVPVIALYDGDGKRKSQATLLTELGRRHFLFHDPDGEAFVRVRVGDHIEVLRVGSSEFRDLLGREYFGLSAKGANRNAIGDAIATLTAMARYNEVCEPVYLRVGKIAQGIVIDRGTPDWSVIEVTALRWRIAHGHLVNFRRGTKTAPLPTPRKANFSKLWTFVNVEPRERVLVAAWLLAALRCEGPFPILLLLGEQGTGKSLTSRTLKLLTDPSGVLLRPPPREDRDLLVAALNTWVPALDNLSGATPTLSDALCRLATGGALAGRKLYTDAEEVAYDLQRPVILNGIDDPASRPDLAERCLHLTLPRLANRRTEAELKTAFAADGPAIMAALLDGLVLALRDTGQVQITMLPRMADFAQWVCAGLPALGFSAEDFLEAYRRNRADAVTLGLEASPFATAICQLMRERKAWTGTARELLTRLNQGVGEERERPGWPLSPKGVANALHRWGPSLRSVGIAVERTRDAHNQYWTFACNLGEQVPQVPQPPSNQVTNGRLVDVALAGTPCTMGPDTEKLTL